MLFICCDSWSCSQASHTASLDCYYTQKQKSVGMALGIVVMMLLLCFVCFGENRLEFCVVCVTVVKQQLESALQTCQMRVVVAGC